MASPIVSRGYYGCLARRCSSTAGRTAPLAMRANVDHNHVLHEHVIIMAINTVSVPRVADSERANVDALGYADDGIVHVTANFGYMETPNVPHVLRLLDPSQTEGRIAVDGASYFLSSIELIVGCGADDVPVAQVPVHRHVPRDRGRRRAIRPTAGSHGDHGFADRGVARLIESAQIPGRARRPTTSPRTEPARGDPKKCSVAAWPRGRVEQGCCGGDAIQDCGAMECSFRGVSKYTRPWVSPARISLRRRSTGGDRRKKRSPRWGPVRRPLRPSAVGSRSAIAATGLRRCP